MTVRWTVRAATDRRAQFARRIKSRHPGISLPERSDGVFGFRVRKNDKLKKLDNFGNILYN